MSGLTYRGVELRTITGGYWFYVVSGLYGGLKVKGDDPTIPGKRGRWAGNRLAEVRTVMLHGKVLGEDNADYDALRMALEAIFDPELPAGDLVVGTDYPGITAPHTIAVRFVNYFEREDVAHLYADLDIQLDTDDDPDWDVGS